MDPGHDFRPISNPCRHGLVVCHGFVTLRANVMDSLPRTHTHTPFQSSGHLPGEHGLPVVVRFIFQKKKHLV